MEVSMSKTRRGKYTDNRICYISKCKGDMRLYLRRKGKLPCFSYLVRGKSFSFYRGKGNNSYTVFAGANYSHVDGTETWNNENYQFPQSLFDRESYSKNSYRNHQEYMQFRYQNQKGKRYWVGKFTLVNLSTPRNASSGFARESIETDIFSNIRKKSLSPKIDLNANLPLSKNQTLTLGVHGKYSANSYHRLYQEQPFEAMTDEDEKALSFQLSAIYNYFSKAFLICGTVSLPRCLECRLFRQLRTLAASVERGVVGFLLL